MVRGVRPLTDIAFEFTMLMGNRELDPDMETIFLMADEQYTHVSSTLIKEITPLCSDEKLAQFVPKAHHSHAASQDGRRRCAGRWFRVELKGRAGFVQAVGPA